MSLSAASAQVRASASSSSSSCSSKLLTSSSSSKSGVHGADTFCAYNCDQSMPLKNACDSSPANPLPLVLSLKSPPRRFCGETAMRRQIKSRSSAAMGPAPAPGAWFSGSGQSICPFLHVRAIARMPRSSKKGVEAVRSSARLDSHQTGVSCAQCYGASGKTPNQWA